MRQMTLVIEKLSLLSTCFIGDLSGGALNIYAMSDYKNRYEKKANIGLKAIYLISRDDV